MSFAFAIAALAGEEKGRDWARWMRPWILAAWIFPTLGIALGSFWAYYELGWGGFWFWDPVENASLMPWLSGTALLHSALVAEKRDTLKRWVLPYHHHFCAIPIGHVFGAFGRSDFRACFCQ